MEPLSQQINQTVLTRGGRLGLILALASIALFAAFWLILDVFDLGRLPRLVLAVCLPPALLAFGVGAFMLRTRPGD